MYSLNVFDSYILVDFKNNFISRNGLCFCLEWFLWDIGLHMLGKHKLVKSRRSLQEELRLRDDQVAMRFLSLA